VCWHGPICKNKWDWRREHLWEIQWEYQKLELQNCGSSVDLSSGELTPCLSSVDLSGGVRLWVILVHLQSCNPYLSTMDFKVDSRCVGMVPSVKISGTGGGSICGRYSGSIRS